jgi:membrane-associated phospholipid phosphatase
MLKRLQNIDFILTKIIYDFFDNKALKGIAHYLGLIPYEFYVIPGMYVAIFITIWYGVIGPVQFHLLPHWFAYSIFQFMKKSIKRERPGCKYKNMKKYIDKSHCMHGHQNQSFPSGHTGVASSLATALFLEMNYSEKPHFFDIEIKTEFVQKMIARLGLFVAAMVSLHRISKGYHSLFDVICGFIIGSSIGYISWTTLETCKKKIDDKFIKQNKKLIIGAKVALTIPVLFLTFKFLTKDVFKLASIKH